MARLEYSYNISTSEKIGYLARNFGVAFSLLGLFVPSLLVPSLSLAISGEVMLKVSKKKHG